MDSRFFFEKMDFFKARTKGFNDNTQKLILYYKQKHTACWIEAKGWQALPSQRILGVRMQYLPWGPLCDQATFFLSTYPKKPQIFGHFTIIKKKKRKTRCDFFFSKANLLTFFWEAKMTRKNKKSSIQASG